MYSTEELSPQTDLSQNYYVFSDSIDQQRCISKELYSEIVKAMPVCTVDVFVYNVHKKEYLMVVRKDKPLQNVLACIGGRLYKGESFFACAQRKCKEEANVDIEPRAILGAYSLVFGESAWGCQTHTPSIAIFATTVQKDSNPLLDEHHTMYVWKPISEVPEHEYYRDIYYNALKHCATLDAQCEVLTKQCTQGDVMEKQTMQSSDNVIACREIIVGKVYKHYSGKLYRVLAIAHDSEDPSLLRVIYQGLYDCPTFGKNPIWDRAYSMFAENVIIDGKEQFRFTEIDNE